MRPRCERCVYRCYFYSRVAECEYCLYHCRYIRHLSGDYHGFVLSCRHFVERVNRLFQVHQDDRQLIFIAGDRLAFRIRADFSAGGSHESDLLTCPRVAGHGEITRRFTATIPGPVRGTGIFTGRGFGPGRVSPVSRAVVESPSSFVVSRCLVCGRAFAFRRSSIGHPNRRVYRTCSVACSQVYSRMSRSQKQRARRRFDPD